jgi:predicted metal-binding protein
MIDKLTKDISPEIKTAKIVFANLVFEERVKLNCFYCPRYDTVWTCPPRIPDCDYKKIFSEYKNLLAVYYKRNIFINTITNIDRKESTNILHKALLKMEKILWDNGHPLAVSFIGGSCKLCKVCSVKKCKNSKLARIPLEACGINVVASMKNIDIEIPFPPTTSFYRIGLLLW